MKLQPLLISTLIIGASLGGVIGFRIPSSRITSLENQIITQQTSISELNDEISKMQSDIEKVADLNQRISSLIEGKDSFQSQVIDLETQLDTKIDEITTLNTQLSDCEKQVSILETQLSSESEQVSDLNEFINALHEEISELHNEVSEFKKLVPPYQNGEWNIIKQFSGMGPMTTVLINIPYEQAKITWTFQEENYRPYLIVELYKPPKSSRVWSSGLLETFSSTTYIYNLSPGEHYLEIDPSFGVGSWTVKIEVWIPE